MYYIILFREVYVVNLLIQIFVCLFHISSFSNFDSFVYELIFINVLYSTILFAITANRPNNPIRVN